MNSACMMLVSFEKEREGRRKKRHTVPTGVSASAAPTPVRCVADWVRLALCFVCIPFAWLLVQP